jgi:hypothetical protein
MSDTEYILLTGHRKSGTTLLHRLFDAHPQLNIYPVDISLLYAFLPCQEPHLTDEKVKERVNRVIKKSTLKIEGKRVSDFCNKFSAEEFASCVWEHSDASVFRKPHIVISAIAAAWSHYTGADQEKPFLFKETSQSIHAYRLLRNELRIKIIQIIRDPRDNYSAIKAGVGKYYSQMGEDEKESLASSINRSRMDLLAAYKLNEQKNDWFFSLRFEDLSNQTEKNLKVLSSFCNIDFDPILLEPTLLGDSFSGNSHEGKRFTGVSSANIGRWRERISHFEAAVIELWMQDVMDRWGYNREITSVDAMNAFSEFYNWYNCRYFYHDSFTEENE